MIQNKKHTDLFLLLIIAITLISCSTKKKTYIHRKYHNITAKYNGYFNGKESLKYGIVKLEKSHKDDYSKILPVYKTDQITKSKTHHPYMDKAIKKGSIVIQKHSINIKNKEYCKWIDDSYFLVASAYFYKGDFLEAKKTFEFINKTYKKTNINITYRARLWTAKCWIEIGDYNSAEMILDELRSKRKFPEKLKKDLHLAFADLYIKQKIHSEAVDEIKSACNIIKRNNKKSRLHYILAQIYQEDGNIKQSRKYFEMVLNTNTEYEMIFNTKMNLAKLLTNKKDVNQMKERLVKMTKDEKNIDYLDQIYFTLGEMSLNQKDTSSAIENYTFSSNHSVNNRTQKALAFLQLGKIYYNNKKYTESKIFYDSAYTFLPEEHVEYNNTKEKKEVLEKLTEQLDIITLEDSLQLLASISLSERRSIIQSIIQKIIKEEEEERISQQNKLYAGRGGINRRDENFGQNISGGKWYFYNPATLSYGMSEFKKIWGKRTLEDDWRRSNKKSTSLTQEDSLSVNRDNKNTNKDLKSEQYYLDQIPSTKDQINTSNKKIINAYYKASVIYKSDLNRKVASEKMLEKITKRFPENQELTPIAHYHLYNSLLTSNKEKANQNKERLITNFPETNYAKTLLDTNYSFLVIEKRKQQEREYNDVFNLYINNKYLEVIERTSDKINNKNDDQKNISKYYLINIFSKFKLYNDTTTFVNDLKKGIKNYKETEESVRCSEILSIIQNPKMFNRRNETARLNSPYLYNPQLKHYLLIISPKQNTDINFVKTLISDFNSKNFSNETIQINTMLIGLEKHLIILKEFENEINAKYYQETLFSNTEVLNELNKTEFLQFIISEENFPEFYKQKDIEGYTRFYNKNIEKN